MKYSQLKVARTTKPKTTQNPDQLCNSVEVDLVLLASNHAFHASEAILALKANKHVFIEEPIALTLQDTDSPSGWQLEGLRRLYEALRRRLHRCSQRSG